MYESVDEFTNATELERENAKRAFHQKHYDQVLLRKAALLAANRDSTVPSQLESAYRAAHENGSIDLRLSGESQTSLVNGEDDDEGDGDDGDESSDVVWSDDEDPPPKFRIYLMYGGRGREEDNYATGAMVTELTRQLKMRYAHVTFEVEPIGVTASLLRARLTPDGGPTRSLIVLWRNYASGQGGERWAGPGGAESILKEWPCIPSIESVSAIFRKIPYLDILRDSGCPINQTEIIEHGDIRRAAASPLEWFLLMKRVLNHDKLVVKLPNCVHVSSLVVCTNVQMFANAVETALNKDVPFIIVQRFVLFNEVHVFVAGGRALRAVLTLHKDNEVALRRRTNHGNGTAYQGLCCTVPMSPILAQHALDAFEAVVRGGIELFSARIDIGVVETVVDIQGGSLACSDVGQVVFINAISCVESDVFPDAPSGVDDSLVDSLVESLVDSLVESLDESLDNFTRANVAGIVSEVSMHLSGAIVSG